MIELKRILHPTDFSTFSSVALRYACGFAEKFGAELHLLHVVQDLSGVIPDPGYAVPPPEEYLNQLRTHAEQSLAAIPGPDWSAGKTIVRAIREGTPFVEIIGYARAEQIDMIVLGTHGRTGLASLLLGSVAERVVRKCPCPVLTVRPNEQEFNGP